MLHLHLSNRTENLFETLADVIAEPLPDVFAPEVIVVEEAGMARWLSQQIAPKKGIAANLEFPLPAAFVWRLIHGQLQEGAAEAGFSKSTLLWYSMALLPGLKDQPGFEPIKHYLDGAEEETKTYQLSRQIADLFDQYLVYRPDLIRTWEAGNQQPDDETERWQADLWRAMREFSTESHWAGLLDAFRQSVAESGVNKDVLPSRVSLFAISSLSPGYIELLSLVAEHIDIHLHILNPSVNYWGDIVSEQDLAKLRGQWRKSGRPDVSDLYMVGNPLLASMGKPCRDFLDAWHDFPVQEHESFVEAGEESLLSHVHGDILNLQARGVDEIPAEKIPLDDSIQIHACHSPMREVQVLHDRLLALFDSRADLKPHEIIVMAPDINHYAPYIEAVFGSAPAERHIPYSVADQALMTQPLVETLLSWLRLPDERFEAPTVMGWLEVTSVQNKLRLDADGVERIRQWVAESGIRWGLDGAHKAELGLPENEHNTWRFGFRRLFFGYAMPSTAEMFDTVAPYGDIEGGEVAWLGQLQDFIEKLAAWRKVFLTPATVREWQGRLNQLMEQFFLPDQHEELLIDNIRESLARVVETAEIAGFEGKLSAQLLHQHLSGMLSVPGHSYRMLAGRVTFCNMVPVRSIPFRVVCMLGMNDGVFPRNQRPLGFDLIARHRRKGDRSLREDDRYLFLESLLAAREVLHISYVGRSQQDNSERLPSVVVTELLDYVEQGYVIDGSEKARKLLHHEHPLQPFSPRNFERGSYAAEWLERGGEPKVFSGEPIELEQEETTSKVVTLNALSRFLGNPARHFLEHTLGIHSAEYEEAMEESERFEIDSLAAYSMKVDMLSDLVSGKSVEERFALYDARGELPHGGLAQVSYDNAMDKLAGMAQRVSEHLTGGEQTVALELVVNDTVITGTLSNVVEGGVIRYRPASIKGKDRLSLWVSHLALCAAGYDGKSYHLGEDADFILSPVESDEAHEHLSTLLSLSQEGGRRPIPLLLESSFEYADRYKKKGDAGAALVAAKKKWDYTNYKTNHKGGDGNDAWVRQAFRDVEPYDDEFEQIAKDVLVPILGYKE